MAASNPLSVAKFVLLVETPCLVRKLNMETLCIESRSPLEDGYMESFHGMKQDELLGQEIFNTLK